MDIDTRPKIGKFYGFYLDWPKFVGGPMRLRHYIAVLWGLDVWFGPYVPFFKVWIALHVILWWWLYG